MLLQSEASAVPAAARLHKVVLELCLPLHRAETDDLRGKRRGSRLVVAFEVDLAEVCGLDYVWRLCEDGRLVVEARRVVKREFRTACPWSQFRRSGLECKGLWCCK